ncbi:MAG: flagellar hook-associated protein FlgK [Clostridium sp.]|nr:flagellar hook-associated protein FlgK [Clostridium sp.]
MPSQFFGLYIAGSGLRAANAALNTTANNIANAQTDGYSRQTVTQQANNALRVFATYGCAGAGVDTIAIERVRDNFYDVKYWNNNCKYGEYNAKSYYMSMIEKYLDDDGTSGFKVIFDKFSAALQSVTTNSSSDTSKQQFIASAKSLTDYFNNMAGNLQELQTDINLEIKESVDAINAIAQKVSTLNRQINTIELSGTKANELRDQRELLIDELSEYIDVDITETAIADVKDAGRDTGASRYIVRIAGGQVLVDGNSYNTLTYKPRAAGEKVNQTDVDGLYDIKWANGNSFNILSSSMGGKLKGLLELRDGNNESNFRGTVGALDTGFTDADGKPINYPIEHTDTVNTEIIRANGSKGILAVGTKATVKNGVVTLDTGATLVNGGKGALATLADGTKVKLTGNGSEVEAPDGTKYKLTDGTTLELTGKTEETIVTHKMTVEVTDEYLKNMQDCTLSDTGGVINIGNKLFYYDDWEFNGVDATGEKATYTFTIVENAAQDKNTGLAVKAKANEEVKTEKKIKYQGIPYYMEQMNAWIRGFAEAVNNIFTSGIDANDNQGCIFFTGNKGNGEGQLTKEDLDDPKKGYYNLSVENFAINEDLIKDASKLGTRSSVDVGVEECGKIEELITLLSNKNIFNFRNGTAGQLLEAILSDSALSASEANTFLETYSGLRNTIDNQRYSISGVDEDEEAVNLVKFQNSYTLASKMIQTLTEVYDQLILRTGV